MTRNLLCSFTNSCFIVFSCSFCSSAVDCGVPKSITLGNLSYSDTLFPSKATYGCLYGYSLEGNPTRSCDVNGTWRPAELPKCKRVRCPHVHRIANGNRYGNMFVYQSQLNFTCHYGYDLKGASSIHCLGSGQWSADAPKCDPVPCGDPGLSPGTSSKVIGSPTHTYNTSVNYECRAGYEYESGNNLITCLATRRWDLSPLQCSPIACGDFVGLTNATWDRGSRVYGENTTFSCLHGYWLDGEELLTCREDGSWSHAVPQCQGQ